MKRLLITICLLAASGVLAQTADVIELSPDDAARAQKAWDTLQKAKADWDSLQKDYGVKYLPAGISGHCTSTVNGSCIPDEWFHGFEFSKDFKAIVPKPQPWTGTTTGGIIYTPAYPSYPCYPSGWTIPSCQVINCNLKYN